MFFDPLSQSENVKCAYPNCQETIPRSNLGYASNNIYAGFNFAFSFANACIFD
jgi:hypothetical protein